MKKTGIALVTTFVLLLSLGYMPAKAVSADFAVKNGVLTKYNGSDENVVIPGDMGITEIGSGVFSAAHKIKSVSIPEGVTKLDDSAFQYNATVETVSLPKSLTDIGEYTFSFCTQLKSINLTDGLKKIGSYAFYHCESLESVAIPVGVTAIEEWTFASCKKLTTVTLPEGLKTIGDTAFFWCDKLVSVNIPSGVTYIGQNAFALCPGINALDVPDSVTAVGAQAFSGTSITKPILVNNGSILCYVPTSADNYSIPVTVTRINDGAFSDCARIRAVTIPQGVTYIGDDAFSGCTSLSSVTIPNTVVTIGKRAFNKCSGITAVSLPDSVQSVGSLAFTGTSITKPLISPDGSTLLYIPSTYTEYAVPDGIKKINGGAFSRNGVIKTITLPDSLEIIGDVSFDQCSALTELKIPNRVRFIGDCAFWGDTSLKTMTIPENVVSIGAETFTHVPLTQIHIDGDRLEFGDNMFSDAYKPAVYGTEGSTAEAYAKAHGYPFVSTGKADPEPPTAAQAAPTKAAVYINDRLVTFEAYLINGSNYIKLRDLATVMNGTSKQFDLGWENQAINLKAGMSYTPVGGELASSGKSDPVTAQLSTAKVLLDGYKIRLTAYTIGGNNYFRLRDIGSAFDFSVIWDGSAQAIRIDTSTGYTD